MKYEQRIGELDRAMNVFFQKKEHVFSQVVSQIKNRLRNGQKVLIFGNGGSASQAQHFAAELVNKFLHSRPAIPALALTTDTSALTSIANDETFDVVFSRQVEALGKEGDVAIGLTTSGNSPNVIEALKAAQKFGLFTVAFTGEGGGKVRPLANMLCDVPSNHTPIIQEVHLLLLHILAEEIEKSVMT